MIIMEIQNIFFYAFVTIFSLGLTILSILSYKKYHNQKLIFISIAFIIFLIKGIILSLSLFENEVLELIINSYSGLFDVLILLFLFIATLKR